MKRRTATAVSFTCLLLGTGLGYAAKEAPPGMAVMRDKPAQEAGLAALQAAETLAGKGSWELLGVARVYYLMGNKAKGQELIDRVVNGKPADSDWQRIAQLYAEAGEHAKAEPYFQRAVAAMPKDDTGQAEIGAYYIRQGQRAKGEELFARALARNPDEVWHYVRAAEAFLNVPAGR
ncbi:MAG: tetratricopeptide repeat protein [Caldimonas sp.]